MTHHTSIVRLVFLAINHIHIGRQLGEPNEKNESNSPRTPHNL